MSFILSNCEGTAKQLIPPGGSIQASDFSADRHNIRLVWDEQGQVTSCALNVPIYMSVITNHCFEEYYSVAQTIIGPNGQQHFSKTLGEAQRQSERQNPHMHNHDYTELMYVMEGSVEEFIEESCTTYVQGQACLLNRNTRHCELMKDNCMLVYLGFSKEYSKDVLEHNLVKKKAGIMYDFTSINVSNKVDAIKQYIEFVPRTSNNDSARQINSILETLSEELLIKKPGQQPMINALLVRLFAYFLDYPDLYECVHQTLDTSSDAYTFNIITRYIEQFVGRPSRKDLAEHFNYSGDHINRIIKKHSGKSMVDYVRDVSITRAEVLLKTTDDSISAIIEKLGFENRSYFYSHFEKKHGVTPTEFRHKYR